MSDTAEPTPDAIMQLGFGFWGSKALLSAIEIGLFTELAQEPLDVDAITKRLGLSTRSSRDFLDTLVALGMLSRSEGRYSNTPETSLFLDRQKPTYVGGMLEMANARLYPFWASLTEAIRTGEPQNEAKQGRDLFDELYKDERALGAFLKAMTGLSLGPASAIAERFPWSKYNSYADIGTAEGGLVATLSKAHPHLEGIGFDLPAVQPHFEAYVEAQAVNKRVRFHAGDFFADALPNADVFIMGHILHDWGLDKKRQLIQKAFQALPSGGALIVYETLIDDDRAKNAFGLLMSLNMLIETREGFDYTGADCSRWMREAGFAETRVEPLAGPDGMVIGVKR